MRYNEFTMLPELAFRMLGGRMTLEGGGGGGGKGGGKGGAPQQPAALPPAPVVPAAPPAPELKQAERVPDALVKRARSRTSGNMTTGGPNSTMLTGSSGVDPSALTVGKTTLLGE